MTAAATSTEPAADPFGRPCTSRGVTPARRGRVVAYYRGDPAQGMWVLWDDDPLRRPRWERACDVRQHDPG